MAERQRLNKLQQSYPLSMPERLYRPFTERLAQLESGLQAAMQMSLMKKATQLQQLHSTVEQHSPKKALAFHQRELEARIQQLSRATTYYVAKQQQQFESTVRTLEALNPLSILTRGFTVAYKDQQMIKSSTEVQKQDQLTLTFHDGKVVAKVTNILPKNEGELL